MLAEEPGEGRGNQGLLAHPAPTEKRAGKYKVQLKSGEILTPYYCDATEVRWRCKARQAVSDPHSTPIGERSLAVVHLGGGLGA